MGDWPSGWQWRVAHSLRAWGPSTGLNEASYRTRPATELRSPGAFDEEGGGVAGEVFGQQRDGLAFGAVGVVPGPEGGAAGDLAFEQHLARDTFDGFDAGDEAQFIILDGDDVAGLEGDGQAVEAEDHARQKDIRVAVGVEPVGAVLLQVAAQGLVYGLDDPGFKCLIDEVMDLDGTAGGQIGQGGPKPVAAAPGGEQAQAEGPAGERGVVIFGRSCWRLPGVSGFAPCAFWHPRHTTS